MRYSAFISYNHRDRATAAWLHKTLEGYRPPKRLWGRPAPWGEIGPRLPPVFRDREELATSSDLAASVREALAESATLIVICSPNAAQSRWVDEEVRTFIASGRRDHIRLLVVDGQVHATDPAQECLPPSLREDGHPEPLAADIRKEADGRQGAKLKLLAGMMGVPYDELRQREAARRQKRLLYLAAASFAGFLIMAGLTVFALVSRAEAVEQREVAERRTLQAERTLDFVKGMFQVADPSEARGATVTAREIVDRAASRLDGSLKEEPTVKAELGATLAEVYGALGLYQRSDALVRRMLAIGGVQPETQARQKIVLGESQLRLADYEGAARTFRAVASSGLEEAPSLRSRALAGLGQALSNLERFAEADRVLREALVIDQRRGPIAAADIARDFEALGINQMYAGELAKAEPLIRQALSIRLRVEGSASPSVSDNYNTLGSIAYLRGDLPSAERFFRGNLASDEKVLGTDHPDTATTRNNLARVLLEQRRFAEAAPLLEQAMAAGLKERGETHDLMAFVFSNLGIARRHTGRPAEADALFQQAIGAAREHQHRTLGPTLADLAEVRCVSGKAREGSALLAEAARVSRADYPDDPWRWAWVENVRGECLRRLGRNAEARQAVIGSMPAIRERWANGTLFRAEAERRLQAVVGQ